MPALQRKDRSTRRYPEDRDGKIERKLENEIGKSAKESFISPESQELKVAELLFHTRERRVLIELKIKKNSMKNPAKIKAPLHVKDLHIGTCCSR